jgi:hypothetical protein
VSTPDPLRTLAEKLRADDTVISPHVGDPLAEPVFGPLAALGPRAAAEREAYALVVESIREGYELHYGTPRILSGQDEDLALLAGDYLYALGLERLAGIGDEAAVAELSDLISLCATCHTEGAAQIVPALWLASAVAVGCGGGDAHEDSKRVLRAGSPDAAESLLRSARATATAAGLGDALDRAAESIDFALLRPADSG